MQGLPHGAIGFIVAAIVAAALSPSLNAMAATTVNDFYLPYVRPAADDQEKMRVSKIATVGWGVVQLAVALAAQWMDQSVLSAGLSVLSITAGPVLGAFLIGVLTSRVGTTSMMAGMVGGIATVGWIWWTNAAAWTWYSAVGAVATMAIAGLVHGLRRALGADRSVAPRIGCTRARTGPDGRAAGGTHPPGKVRRRRTREVRPPGGRLQQQGVDVSTVELWSMAFVFVLATFVGLQVIQGVSRLLHTPLMSLTNAISAIAVVGSIIIAGEQKSTISTVLGVVAVAASVTNIVSGFLITDRMLKMFRERTGRQERQS